MYETIVVPLDGSELAECVLPHVETIANTNEGMADSDRRCFDCHRSVAHGERGISLLPYQNKEMYR